MKQTPQEEKLYELVAPIVKDHDLSIVMLKIGGNEKNGTTLQIMVEHADTGKVTLDECAAVSREVSALLDVEDPIEEAFRLEVSSPGIDRPLVKIEDYENYKGLEAKIEIEPPLEGRKRFRGRLLGVEENNVCVKVDNAEAVIPFTAIQRAKLVMTDELLKFTRKT